MPVVNPGEPVPEQTSGKANVGGMVSAVGAFIGILLSRWLGPEVVTPDLQIAVDAVAALVVGAITRAAVWLKVNYVK